MFTGNEDMEATALRKQGWSISAIARHLGRSRETVRNHLNGTRHPGERRRSEPDPFEEYVAYLRIRLTDDPHVWASSLYDEVVALHYPLSYQSFTRGLRAHHLRPHCEACAGVKGRSTIEIDHPPGAELQWDWDELPEAPWGGDGHLLLGTLPCSSKTRGVFAESEEQPRLIEALDKVCRRFGGTARDWRFDRMATVVNPESGVVQASFVPVAKHYGVRVLACPPRRGNRKGSVEKNVEFSSQRFWRTMTARTMAEAQESYDRFCERIGDTRARSLASLVAIVGSEEAARAFLEQRGHRRPSVADLASLERLVPLPDAPYPAAIESQSKVNSHCLASFEGNSYSVPTGLIGTEVVLRHRLGTEVVEIYSHSGICLASHHRRTPGAGYVVRDPEHKAALSAEVLAAFNTDRPCRKKANRPPSSQARAEAERIVRRMDAAEDIEVVVDLSAYEALIAQTTRKDTADEPRERP